MVKQLNDLPITFAGEQHADYTAHYFRVYNDDDPPAQPTTIARNAMAHINHDRLVVECPQCGEVLFLNKGVKVAHCAQFGHWFNVSFHPSHDTAEGYINKMPGTSVRNWHPNDMDMPTLKERSERAQEKYARDGVVPTSLSIGVPYTFAVGESLTTTNMNANSTVLDDLAGRNGAVEFENNIAIEPSNTLPVKEGEISYMLGSKEILANLGISGAGEDRRFVVIPRASFANSGIVYLDSNNEGGFSVLPIGRNGQRLTIVNGRPAWQ